MTEHDANEHNGPILVTGPAGDADAVYPSREALEAADPAWASGRTPAGWTQETLPEEWDIDWNGGHEIRFPRAADSPSSAPLTSREAMDPEQAASNLAFATLPDGDCGFFEPGSEAYRNLPDDAAVEEVQVPDDCMAMTSDGHVVFAHLEPDAEAPGDLSWLYHEYENKPVPGGDGARAWKEVDGGSAWAYRSADELLDDICEGHVNLGYSHGKFDAFMEDDQKYRRATRSSSLSDPKPEHDKVEAKTVSAPSASRAEARGGRNDDRPRHSK